VSASVLKDEITLNSMYLWKCPQKLTMIFEYCIFIQTIQLVFSNEYKQEYQNSFGHSIKSTLLKFTSLLWNMY